MFRNLHYLCTRKICSCYKFKVSYLYIVIYTYSNSIDCRLSHITTHTHTPHIHLKIYYTLFTIRGWRGLLLLASSRTQTLIHYYSVSEPSGSCVTRCAYAPPFASHTQWAGGAWRAHAPQAARDARGQRLCACLSFPSVHHRSLNEKPKKKSMKRKINHPYMR